VNTSGCINAGRATINLGTQWTGHTLTVISYGERVAILNGTNLVRSPTHAAIFRRWLGAPFLPLQGAVNCAYSRKNRSTRARDASA